MVEVIGPSVKFGLKVRSGRSVFPLVLIPFSVDTDLGSIETVIPNPKDLVTLSVDHSWKTARLEC